MRKWDAAKLVMQPPFDLWISTTVAADVAATMHMSVESLAERQQRRLAAVISSAIHRSPLYRHLLKGADRMACVCRTCRSCARAS